MKLTLGGEKSTDKNCSDRTKHKLIDVTRGKKRKDEKGKMEKGKRKKGKKRKRKRKGT